MSALEQAKTILDTISADLKREKEALAAHLKDPRLLGWKTIDLLEHHELLAGLGIDTAVVGNTLVEYPRQADRIARQISAWGNEIGNQLADLIGHADPEHSLAAARKLEEKTKRLAVLKEELFASTGHLVRADELLRQQLNLKSMLEVARLLFPGKRDFFDGGIVILTLLRETEIGREGARTLTEICQEPAKLETRYKRLEVVKLPRVVEEILFRYIEEALAAIKEVKVFVDSLRERIARELVLIAAIEHDLKALASESTAVLFAGITEQAGVTANLISSLYHKRQIKETIATVNEALEMLNVFHLLLKNRLIPGVQTEVGVSDSVLNPVPVSIRAAHSFFMGATGVIRSLKLMLTSLTGKEAINEVELQLLLEKGIRSCKVFCGKPPADARQLNVYLNTLISRYPKPFPYDDLLKLARGTLTTYGSGVEKFIVGYDVPHDLHTLAVVAIPAKAGKLITVIRKHKKAFEKANAEAA